VKVSSDAVSDDVVSAALAEADMLQQSVEAIQEDIRKKVQPLEKDREAAAQSLELAHRELESIRAREEAMASAEYALLRETEKRLNAALGNVKARIHGFRADMFREQGLRFESGRFDVKTARITSITTTYDVDGLLEAHPELFNVELEGERLFEPQIVVNEHVMEALLESGDIPYSTIEPFRHVTGRTPKVTIRLKG
jgi:hypothetical protein